MAEYKFQKHCGSYIYYFESKCILIFLFNFFNFCIFTELVTTFLGGKDKCIAISTFYEIINKMQDLVSLVKEDCQNETGVTLEKLWNDKDLTDVTLVSKDGQQVLVHRAILCSRSSFLRGILMESLHQNTFLYLGMADHLVLEALVQFVYLSTCIIPSEQLKSLAEMANQLGFDDLESAIEKVKDL